MTDAANMPWRAPMPPDWTERAKAMTARLKAGAIDDPAAAAIELRRLAGCRLSPSAQLTMERLARAYAAANLPAEPTATAMWSCRSSPRTSASIPFWLSWAPMLSMPTTGL